MIQEKVRLQKVLAACGVASRRKAEGLIKNGQVKVNGLTAKLGDKVDTRKDRITVFGKAVLCEQKKRYIMLHKPRGYITTAHDERDRKCVMDLLQGVKERVFPVGRLDKDSEGLLFFTNDGDFANALMHPSHHETKTYRVTIGPKVSKSDLQSLREGIVLDGKMTQKAIVDLIYCDDKRSVLNIVLTEGRNRQIRKMCEILGLEVKRLKRVAFGKVKLGMLQPGKWRDLTVQELQLFVMR